MTRRTDDSPSRFAELRGLTLCDLLRLQKSDRSAEPVSSFAGTTSKGDRHLKIGSKPDLAESRPDHVLEHARRIMGPYWEKLSSSVRPSDGQPHLGVAGRSPSCFLQGCLIFGENYRSIAAEKRRLETLRRPLHSFGFCLQLPCSV